MSDPHQITCPKCGMTSHNSWDVVQGYCGNCHDWTSAGRAPADGANPMTVPCPVCFAPISVPCNAPTETGRRNVEWFHHKRQEAVNG